MPVAILRISVFSDTFNKENYSICYMTEKYYLDTSIWLDFFENRNEPNLPKSDFAHELLDKITKNNDKIIYSDIVIIEFRVVGYQSLEIEKLFEKIKAILIFVESQKNKREKQKTYHQKETFQKAMHSMQLLQETIKRY